MVVVRRRGVQQEHRSVLTLFVTNVPPVAFVVLVLIAIVAVALLQTTPHTLKFNKIISNIELEDYFTQQTATDYPRSSEQKNRRVFVEYQSSKWEQSWLDEVGHMDQQRMFVQRQHCSKVGNESEYVKRFLQATCTSLFKDDWCEIYDYHKPIYFHRKTGQVVQHNPLPNHTFAREDHPVWIDDADQDVFSRFVYRDTRTGEIYHEYIEPLVSMLRHPLTCCEYNYAYGVKLDIPSVTKCKGNHWFMENRGQIVPPPKTALLQKAGGKMLPSTRYYYFDGGASDWVKGAGGPSLSYFYGTWTKRHGMVFDSIEAWEGATSSEKFYQTVPFEHHSWVHFHPTFVRSTLAEKPEHPNWPFIPAEIMKMARPEDYVLFKLDIDSPGVEEGNVDFLLANSSGILSYIDEFVYEFHLPTRSKRVFLEPWYQIFLKLRKAGIRAHSWI